MVFELEAIDSQLQCLLMYACGVLSVGPERWSCYYLLRAGPPIIS
jgi:hypothetical protein